MLLFELLKSLLALKYDNPALSELFQLPPTSRSDTYDTETVSVRP